jgi:putative transposase
MAFAEYEPSFSLEQPPRHDRPCDATRFLSTDWTLAQFDTTRRAAQARYRAFLLDGIDDALAEAVRGQRLGTDALLRKRSATNPPLAEIPREQIEPLPPSLDEIFTPHLTQAVFVAYGRHGYTIGKIAEHLGCHYSSVSRRLRREEALEALRECKT